MKTSPLTNILIKIFANGFYRVHAGLFLFVGLVMVGAVPPERLWMYEKSLIIAFVSSPMMALVFALWLVYTIKATHYVAGQIFAVNQQFLFYSSNSVSRKKQFISWFSTQFVILLPIIAYGIMAVFVAVGYGYYLSATTIIFYLLLLNAGSTLLFIRLVNRLVDGSKQSIFLKIGRKWPKPFFSLFIYNLFDKMKVAYIITKVLSWLIVTGVFLLFADVRSDLRVAVIAMLAIITAHALLIYNQRVFEEKYLSFSRNLPYSTGTRFLNYLKTYLVLLVPEAVWLFSRFNPAIAVELLLAGLSIAMLFHCLLYRIGINMDRYLQWILFLFVVIFWVILYKLLWLLVIVNLAVSFLVFYVNYYNDRVGEPQ